jgi:CubicO group peptidase (beta-lactamase class C family)
VGLLKFSATSFDGRGAKIGRRVPDFGLQFVAAPPLSKPVNHGRDAEIGRLTGPGSRWVIPSLAGLCLWVSCCTSTTQPELLAPTSRPHAPVLASGKPAPAPPAEDDALRAEVQSLMRAHHRVGAALAMIEDGRVILRETLGEIDLDSHAPVTSSTVFPVASLSKPVLAAAVLQVAERTAERQGITLAAVLDADIDTYLEGTPEAALRIRHPAAPDTPITLRMLLSHVSGILDHYDPAPHDVPVEAPSYAFSALPGLLDAHRAYLHPDGPFFSPDSFVHEGPLIRSAYSSVASSMAAHFVSAQSGVPFDRYCRQYIFDRLGMSNTAWRLADLAALRAGRLRLAMPYVVRTRDGVEQSVPVTPAIWENTFFPSASLKSTVDDYARFVIALSGGGPGIPALLETATLREMVRVQYPALDPLRGLIVTRAERDGTRMIEHAGQNNGFRSDMYFTSPDEDPPPAHRYGFVILTNGDGDLDGSPLEPKIGTAALRWARRRHLTQPGGESASGNQHP